MSEPDGTPTPWGKIIAAIVVPILIVGAVVANHAIPAMNSETTEYATFCVAYGKPSGHVDLLERAINDQPGALPLADLRRHLTPAFRQESLEEAPPGLVDAARIFREAMLQAFDAGSLAPVQTPEVQQAMATLEGPLNACPGQADPAKD